MVENPNSNTKRFDKQVVSQQREHSPTRSLDIGAINEVRHGEVQSDDTVFGRTGSTSSSDAMAEKIGSCCTKLGARFV
jgi:hypothetical protein